MIPYPAAAVAITVCVAFSTFGAANGTLISGSRYGLVHAILLLLPQNVDIRFHTGLHVKCIVHREFNLVIRLRITNFTT